MVPYKTVEMKIQPVDPLSTEVVRHAKGGVFTPPLANLNMKLSALSFSFGLSCVSDAGDRFREEEVVDGH